MRGDFPAAVPEIPVRDLRSATVHYEIALGFTVDWSDADLGLAGISRGNCRLFLADLAYREHRGNGGPVSTWLNMESEGEVDALYRLWSASGAQLLSPPEAKPWGLYEFTATDPDGNQFRVFYDQGTTGSVAWRLG